MTPTIEYLEKYFGIYNAKYFYSILPVPEFELMNTKYLLGQYCPPHKIRISKAYEGVEVFFRRTRQTLWGGRTDANPKLSLNDT